MQRKLFCGTASEASGGGAASLVPFKKGSRKMYNYSTKLDFLIFGKPKQRNARRACGRGSQGIVRQNQMAGLSWSVHR